MGQAAQALSGMSESLAAAALPASGTPLDSAMAGAYSAASMAAATPSTPTAAMAASAMAAASQAASASASAQGLAPEMMPGMPGMSGDSQMGTGPQAVDPRMAKLKALGITLADWARLPGTLRSQILQAAEEGAPQEYRTLIQRYFREVARRGSASDKERK